MDDYPCEAEEYILYSPSIGEGAYASVYRAKVRATGEDVAIKIMEFKTDGEQADNLEQIRKEISVMRQLRHENLVQVYVSFVCGDMLWIVMPLLVDSCLGMIKSLYPKGFKDEKLIATIIRETLKGLLYVHNDGYIHRDIKAGNILVSGEGKVQLADFGVAGAMNDAGEKSSRRTFTGTPCWMAPEVMSRDEANGYDSKADVWSIGITAMELAMGGAPYAHYQPMKILLMTLQGPPPSFAEYPEKSSQWTRDFHKFVEKCLKKDPKDRPTVKKLLEHPWLKKAGDANYLKEQIVAQTLELSAGRQYMEKNIDDLKENDEGGGQGSGFWIFEKKDITKVKNNEINEIHPVAFPASHVSAQATQEGEPQATEQVAPSEFPEEGPQATEQKDDDDEDGYHEEGRFGITTSR